MTRALCVVITLFLLDFSPAAAQEPGALALDERGQRYALSLDGEADALSTCGTTDCEIVATFSACFGVAHSSPTHRQGVWAWAEALTRTEARRDALNQCTAAGGEACQVFADVCVDAPAAEATLRLDRTARRQIQQRLQAAGFDAGAADGLFGPRTRAAIRQWQESRAAPATGYLNRPAVETLTNPDSPAPLPASPGYRTVAPATPPAITQASPPPEAAAPLPDAPPQHTATDELPPSSAQPPQIPDGSLPLDALIQVDRFFLRIERQLQAGDHAAAFLTIEQIAQLYDTRGIQKPPDVEYRYAQLAAQAGSFHSARDAADRYIAATGRDGAHYRDVLKLLDLIELNEQSLDHCTASSYLASCWRTQAEPSQCVIWDNSYVPYRSVAWSGSCLFGKANGEGTLIWTQDGDDFRSDTGLLQNGQKQGEWAERRANGNMETGLYVDGIRQGQWTLTTADGSNNDGRIMQGQYTVGARNGPWAISWPDGETLHAIYENGVMSGPSMRRFRSGAWIEGEYVNGEKEGEWKHFNAGGDVLRMETFAAGVLNGPWRNQARRYAFSGATIKPDCDSFGNYVEGQREGRWTECLGNGTPFSAAGGNDIVWSGAYAGDKRQGRWVGTLRQSIRPQHFIHYGRIEGLFDNGSAVVTAIQEQYNGGLRGLMDCHRASTTPYLVDGKRHGTGWRVRGRDCQCFETTWENGSEVRERAVRRGNCNREIFGR